MTDKQIGDILQSIVVIVDTREQKNQHILDWMDAHKIKYVVEKLDHGDYSFYVTKEGYEHLSKRICIEKKNSLTEIAGNFTKGRERFHREFQRAKDSGTKFHLLIENTTWKKVVNESYRSNFSAQSMIGSILTFSNDYDVPVWFVGKDESPMLIYNIIYYGLRSILKKF